VYHLALTDRAKSQTRCRLQSRAPSEDSKEILCILHGFVASGRLPTYAANTQSATNEARTTQSGTCEGSHLARSQSRPSHAIIQAILLLLLLEGNHNASEKHGT